jgi:hypothetical protein
MFSSYLHFEGPKETIPYGGDTKGEVIGVGDIPISQKYSITNVLHVDLLGYNLLSVSQLSEIGFDCLFSDKGVSIIRREHSSIVLTGRLRGRLYLVDLNKSKVFPKTYLVAKSSMGWLWHRRLAHFGMRNLAKLLKDEHILGLTNVHFEKDRICKACQAEKQVGAPHPPNSILTTSSPLELIHMDLFGSVAYISIGGNKCGLVIVDDYSRFTWALVFVKTTEIL